VAKVRKKPSLRKGTKTKRKRHLTSARDTKILSQKGNWSGQPYKQRTSPVCSRELYSKKAAALQRCNPSSADIFSADWSRNPWLSTGL
jgi:hypothetical protein